MSPCGTPLPGGARLPLRRGAAPAGTRGAQRPGADVTADEPVAEGCGNRTHREPEGPAADFEDQETHQDPCPSTTAYLSIRPCPPPSVMLCSGGGEGLSRAFSLRP